MTIEYRGKNAEEERDYREAYICYDETKAKEQEKADKVFEILEDLGWKIYQEEGCAYIPVYDKDEYLELVEDYKRAKKMIKCK